MTTENRENGCGIPSCSEESADEAFYIIWPIFAMWKNKMERR